LCARSDHQQVARRIDDGCWVRCNGCALVYLSPAPTPPALEAFYANYYSDYRALVRPARPKLEEAARRGELDVLSQFALQALGAPPKSVVDVGCAQGARLVMLGALGTSTLAGCEMDPDAARWAREAYGLDVRAGDADVIAPPPGGFHVLFLSEVVEHLLDPKRVLRQCAALLASDGWLFLSTPNAGVRHRARHDWLGLSLDLDHLNAFDDASIRRLLADAGFETMEVLSTGMPSMSSEMHAMERPSRARGIARRVERVARRVGRSLRTQAVRLDPHDGFRLLVSARRI
jgi:SAM-dependent methyltransferase